MKHPALLPLLLLTAAPALAVPELVPIPAPSLTGMEPAVQQQLAEGLAELEALAARGGVPADELAEAFGDMGRVYLAYDLGQPGAACLKNAHALAPEDFRWPYLLGALHQNERRLGEAVASYTAALALDPGDLAALIRLGNVHLAGDDPESATQVFERALAVEAGAAAALAGRAKAAAARGDFAAAVGDFETALARQPQASALRYPLAIAYRELGRVDDARRHLAQRGDAKAGFPDPLAQQLLQLATGAGVHLMYGNRAMRAGNLELAVARYRQGLAANPRSAPVHQALGAALARRDDTEGAVHHYSASLAIDPDNPPLHYNLGTILAEQGDDEQAIRHFRAALALAPDYHNARFNLAGSLARSGRYDDALEHYRTLHEQQPGDVGTRFYLAQTLHRLGHHAEAAEQFEEMVREEPSRARARLGLAAARAAMGAAAAAETHLRAVLGLAGAAAEQRAQAHLQLADLAAEHGDPGAAEEHYGAALALRPGWVAAAVGAAAQAARQGRWDEAVASYGEVLERQPRHAAARFGQAMALLLAQRYGEARQRLEEGLRLLPGSPELAHALAQLLAACPAAELRDGERALELSLSLFRSLRNPLYAETAAMAFAELGRFDDAAAWQRRLLREAERAGQENLLPRLRRRLALYERHEPCRAPWLTAP